jgi:hypothetical protein
LNTPAMKHPIDRQRVAAWVALQSLRLVWGTVRLPVFVLLRVAEPLVRIVLSVLGLLGVLMALFYRVAASPPHRPFWLLLGFGLSCGLARLLYERLLRFLAPTRG